MIKEQLPGGWKKVKVSDVCIKVIGGGTPSTKNDEYWQDGIINWVTSADIYGIKDIRPRKKITLKAIEESTTNILPEGGIIVVTRVGLGKLAIAPYDLCFSQDSQGLILNKEVIDTAYALWFLSKAVQIFKYENRGTTISGVTKKQLIDIPLLLPSIPVQKAIVAKIEELFSELEAGVQELEIALRRLKVFRQAVLHHYLNNQDWKKVKLGEVSKKVFDGPFGSNLKTVDYIKEPGYQVVRLENIGVMKFIANKLTFISEAKFHDLEKHELFEGDIVFSSFVIDEVRATILPKLDFRAINKADCFCVRVDEEKIDRKYLLYSLSSQSAYKLLTLDVHGATRPRINTTQLKNFVLRLPDLAVQSQIVLEIEAKLSEADAVEATIRYEITKAEALKQSILKKAFEGKLVHETTNDITVEEPITEYKASGKALNGQSKQLTLF